jgi:hypothetical protein
MSSRRATAQETIQRKVDPFMAKKTYKTGIQVGYALVSTRDQDLALQLDALKACGCIRVFTEKAR